MDDESMNRYEKQLYTVFKTFDVDNEEALDRSAVNQLCDALQLEDRGAALVNTLFERRSDRVTFAQFRNGLLAVLGGASTDSAPSVPPDAPQHSDDDSSGREVAPKFVFGSKKYGRRSRPLRAAAETDEPPSPRSSSASRVDCDDKRARQRMRCRRSASAMETRNESDILDTTDDTGASVAEPFEHDRRIDRDEAFALCRGLHMDGIDRSLVERIFEDSGTADTTVGEFFDRLNASLTTTIEETSGPAPGGGGGEADDAESGGVASELVLEAWERAGVQQPRRLLAELGFGAPALRPPELERALDAELRALPDEPAQRRAARPLLLAAALALCRLRLERADRRAERAAAERDKLRADVAEANRRARLLAQEVDESHARIETELASVRRAEARQAEAARQAAAENVAERERAAAATAELEAEVSRRTEAEARLRAELGAQRERADEQEARAALAERRAAESEREQARLAAAVRAERERCAAASRRGGQAAALAARAAQLQRDNEALRDRNDELCAALEGRSRRTPPPAPSGDLSAELNSLLVQECNSSPISEVKTFWEHSKAVITFRDMLESVNTISQVDDDACSWCVSVRDAAKQLQEQISRLDPASTCHATVQTDSEQSRDSEQLLLMEQAHQDEKDKLTALVKDLECSLEQMKTEYEKCEEYWSGKLEAEREEQAEEQRAGDERLALLLRKVADYERQFAGQLPPIDERRALEAQVTDLEEEFSRYRRDKEAELRAAASELRARAERLSALERRRLPDPRPADGAEVRSLRARCGRAEAALRRLHARLAAADLLVKELYVENCQLAHLRPL